MASKKEVQSEKKAASRKKSAVTEEKKNSRSKKSEEVVAAVEVTEVAESEVIEEAASVQEKMAEEVVVGAGSEEGVESAVVEDIKTVAAEAEVSVEVKASEGEVDGERGIKRYDVIITSERAGYRPPKVAVATMVQQLAFRGYASPVAEAIAETWTEIYFEPGVAAHEIFLEKAYTSDIPVFKEICLKFTDKAYFCDYTETPKRPLYWSIEIRGSRFTNPIGAFRKLFTDALSLRIATASRDFTGLPEHAVVPEEEVPAEKKKRERSNGLAGCEVEEF